MHERSRRPGRAGYFPDGQLYVDLRGYAPTPPIRPIEALAGFLTALGVPAEQVPVDPDQAAALYRTLLAGRRVLVVLDNARDVAQVRPLLPGGTAGAALVTSRDALGGLVAREGAGHSYAALVPPARRLFRLLGLVPGADFTALAAAALAGTDTAQARRLLDRLAGAHLVEPRAAGRYAFHDLLRLYAAECAGQDERAGAEGRLHGWYLDTAVAAADVLYPHMLRLPRQPPAGPAAPGFADHAAALAWLEAERQNLVAAVRHATASGPRPAGCLLADALRGFFHLRRYLPDWLEVGEAALTAARVDGDRRAQAAAHHSIGTAYRSLGEHHRALRHYEDALRLARGCGWRQSEATALGNLGIVCQELGRLDEAAAHLTAALHIYAQVGDRDGPHRTGAPRQRRRGTPARPPPSNARPAPAGLRSPSPSRARRPAAERAFRDLTCRIGGVRCAVGHQNFDACRSPCRLRVALVVGVVSVTLLIATVMTARRQRRSSSGGSRVGASTAAGDPDLWKVVMASGAGDVGCPDVGDLGGTLATAVGVFAGTNVDDLIVLTVLFLSARAAGSPRPWRIWAGQYLGIGVLVAVSAVAALGLTIVPDRWVGLLGVIPFAFGMKGLVAAVRARDDDQPPPVVAAGLLSVAGVTIANGADNISVYTPTFRTIGLTDSVITVAVFAVGVALWCLAGSWLGAHRKVILVVQHYGHWIVPCVFMLIGAAIVIESDVIDGPV